MLQGACMHFPAFPCAHWGTPLYANLTAQQLYTVKDHLPCRRVGGPVPAMLPHSRLENK